MNDDELNEFILLHGERVQVEIPEDMYERFLDGLTNEKLVEHYANCLTDERYENLVILKKECEKRKIEITLPDSDKVGKHKGIKYKWTKLDD